MAQRSEEHTSELQSHSDLPSFPTRRSSDLLEHVVEAEAPMIAGREVERLERLHRGEHGRAGVIGRECALNVVNLRGLRIHLAREDLAVAHTRLEEWRSRDHAGGAIAGARAGVTLI